MTFRRRLLPAGIVAALLLSACGGSDSAGSETSGVTVPTTQADEEPTEDFTQVEDDPAGTPGATEATEGTDLTEVPDAANATEAPGTTVADPGDGGATDAAEGPVAVSMVEWEIDAPTEYPAGDVTFSATNDGNFPHEFVVIRGDGYESLPLDEGGAVIEDDLPPGALIDRTERVSSGSSADLTVTLEAGNYVLLCNLGGGANSHAGRGQTLDVTVS